MEIIKPINGTEYTKNELEKIVQMCQNRIGVLDREERVQQLLSELKQLKLEIKNPELIKSIEECDEEFDYTHR